MNSGIEQLRNVLGPNDPAARVHADPVARSAALRGILAASAPAPRRAARRRWLVAVPATAMLTGAAIALTVAGPGDLGPAEAQALEITKKGDAIDVRIVDPEADPGRYRKEFAAYGLNVDLQLKPASPSLVGAMMYADDGSKTLMSKITEIPGRDCGQIWCRSGVRIPVKARGPIKLLFGRAAKSGERYFFTGDPTARGEILEGLAVRNRTVSEVTAMVRQRGVTIGRYLAEPGRDWAGNWDYEDHVLPAGKVSGSWYVHEVSGGLDRRTVSLVVASWPAGG